MRVSLFDQAWYRALSWVTVLAYMSLIFHQSGKAAVPLPLWFPYQDKVFHFAEFHLLAFLLLNAAAQGGQKQRFWFAFALASLYGASDELHQYFVPGRECSVGDWIADILGAWSGAYLFLKSEGLWRRREIR